MGDGTVLANDKLKITLWPHLGGRIESFFDQRTGKEWMWHSPGHAPLSRSIGIGASYDERWSGGWDETFPNAAPGLIGRRRLPIMGELWSQPWRVVETTPFGLKLRYPCKTIPVQVTKTITLHQEKARLHVSYSIFNESSEPVPYYLQLNPSVAVDPGDSVVLPDGSQRSISQVDGFDLTRAEGFEEGILGVRNRSSHSMLRLRFDARDFPVVDVKESYGGWRGQSVVVPRIATGSSGDVAVQHAMGRALTLTPHETRDFEVWAEAVLETHPPSR